MYRYLSNNNIPISHQLANLQKANNRKKLQFLQILGQFQMIATLCLVKYVNHQLKANFQLNKSVIQWKKNLMQLKIFSHFNFLVSLCISTFISEIILQLIALILCISVSYLLVEISCSCHYVTPIPNSFGIKASSYSIRLGSVSHQVFDKSLQKSFHVLKWELHLVQHNLQSPFSKEEL